MWRSRWMQSLCGFLHRRDHDSWSLLGGRPNTNPGDHGTPNVHNCWSILIYHMWGSTWIFYFYFYLKKNLIEIAFGWAPGHIWLHTTLEGMWSHYMILEVYGTASFGHSLSLGSHKFMVTALGSCVKWTLGISDRGDFRHNNRLRS